MFARPVAFALSCALAGTAAAADPPCALERRDQAWLQAALDGWAALSGPILGAARDHRPWIVLYDPRCTFHIWAEEAKVPAAKPVPVKLTFDGQPVVLLAEPHGGEVKLPSGGKVKPEVAAATSLYDENTRTFFFSALPEVWRADTHNPPERPEAFALGVMAHELVHTLQLAPLLGRILAVQERMGLPAHLDDDMIQEKFSKNRRFVRAYEAERDALDAALAATTRPERERLARAALKLVRARHDRFYRGKDKGYRDLEEIFLGMEGLAVWAHWKLAEQRPETVYFEKERDRFWSQSEGYALVRLLELLEVPDWRKRLLPPELASPLALLAEAL